jgi:ribosomal protein L37E
VTTAVASGPSLTAEDRCDRCGAQAYIRVELSAGGELLFCAHHGREHADKLRSVALNIHDESQRLDETPATAALEER